DRVVLEVGRDARARKRPEGDAGVGAPLVAIPEPAPVEASVQRDRAPTGGAPEDPILPGGVSAGRDLHAVHHLEAVLEVLVGAGHLQVEAVAALEIQPERLE